MCFALGTNVTSRGFNMSNVYHEMKSFDITLLWTRQNETLRSLIQITKCVFSVLCCLIHLIQSINTKGALFLQHFVIDESFSTIMSRGSYQDIGRWYSDSIPQLRMAVFVTGTDELCIVEESNRMRIYSFISQSFRYV